MSKVQLAREILTFMGAKPAEVKTLAKGLSFEIGEMLKGVPKRAKKEFYCAARQLTKNPYNTAAEQTVKRVIKNSPDVVKYATLPGGEVLEPFQNIRTIEKYQALVGPMQAKQSVQNIMDNISLHTKDIQECITPTIIEFSPKQIAQMQKEVYKSIGDILKQPWVQMKSDARNAADFFKSGAVAIFTPKSLRQVLKDTVKLSDENFGKAFYEKLLSSKNITERAPKNYTVTSESAPMFSEGMGGFNAFKNTIEFTREFADKTKGKQAGLLAHELLHWEQTDKMIRTFGIERYIEALEKRSINILKSEEAFANKTDQELAKIAEEELAKSGISKESIKQAFEKSISAPKINPNSKTGKQAAKYLEATENYQPPKIKDLGLGIKVIDSTEGYTTSVLEKEAYKVQAKTQMFTNAFVKLNRAFA